MHPLQCRLYVVVQAEEVGWIILVLQFHQPPVVLAVGFTEQLLSFFEETGEVQIYTAVREPAHLRPYFAGPGEISFGLDGILPGRIDAEIEQSGTVAVGGGIFRNPTDGASQ